MGNDPTDPTDFLGTALATLTPLDAALRCQVCKDLFNTPMLTACAHSFCSLCIRRCYAADGRCPTCRTMGQDAHLRKNAALGEAVEAWKSARTGVLGVGKGAGTAERGVKRKLEEQAVGRRTRSKAKRIVAEEEDDVIQIEDSEGEEDIGDSVGEDDGLVACPMCSQRMKEAAVFSHLDHCDGQAKSTPSRHQHSSSNTYSSPASLNPLTRAARTRAATAKPPPTRLPQLNYSLLKDSALRKKLQELGIPTWGSRQALTRRHTEWVALWNANCDERQPRSKRELLAELDTWERSQGGGSGSASGHGSKEFDKQGWARSNRSQFDDLIAQARRGRAKAVAARDAAEGSTDEANEKEKEKEKEERDGDGDAVMEAAPPSSTIPTEEDDTASTTAPYAANASAMAAVRAKLATVDRGADAPPPSTSSSNSTSLPLHAAAPAPAQRAHEATAEEDREAARLASPPLGLYAHARELARPTDMFCLPAEPVSDVEEGGGGF
ncbi:uncharacterized protein K452DRAFT_317096 [Aplosporella prunicola CBS 121167]|uniref:Postreplication repair E3 ubiquitin-protein ligase RAD18 n=1 Tax=Aplosporella prunicola CBS 121167 TaxID=1176127 RepID=A0A6A6BHJ7_9PEZI|nr:uncharacterized protein K452DRAFT_317096 [Aplosporella prunicola CBS 121167]KAF2143622.1 hypothetical protein K452DRAFT_317096 [Aplosporella prunicola CBS 121167]